MGAEAKKDIFLVGAVCQICDGKGTITTDDGGAVCPECNGRAQWNIEIGITKHEGGNDGEEM